MIWQTVKLGDVCEIVMGQAPSGDTYNEDKKGYPLIAGAGDFKNGCINVGKYTTKPTKISKDDDIVISIRASIGDKVWVDDGYCLGRGVAALRASNKVDKNYLWHTITNVENKLLSKGRGATFLQVNKDDIQSLDIPLPPLAEQKRIAAILDKAHEIKAKRELALAKLDELAEFTFIEMFGDLIFNSHGWDLNTFHTQFKSVRYGTGSPPIYEKEGIPFIRATNIKNGKVEMKGIKYISPSSAAKIEKCKLKYGDVIIVRSGVNTGDCAMIPEKLDGAYAAFDLILDMNPIDSNFYSFLLNTDFGKKILEPLTRRAAQPHLNADQIKNLLVVVPPNDLKTKFFHFKKSIDLKRNLYMNDLEHFNSLTKSLQNQAFTTGFNA